MQTALITGITGQDGSYLAELLLSKGYEVHGLKRRSSLFNTQRIDHLYEDHHLENRQLILHYGDLSDSSSLTNTIGDVRPDEVYNLAAQSHVHVSFVQPEYTAEVSGLGTLRILEAIRMLGLTQTARFYQASTSELYGLVQETPQSETTRFYPRSPYAVAKLYAYWITVNYRESYNMYACNGILFNHESSRRGETFVTRKITRSLARISMGLEDCLHLGNLDSLRDWGHAKEYVEAQWLMLQQEHPEDYVIATGRQITVRDFFDICAKEIGIDVVWEGSGVDEVGIVAKNESDYDAIVVGQVIVRVSANYYRPLEVGTLLGNPSKALKELGWQATMPVEELVADMINQDLIEAKKLRLLHDNQFGVGRSFEV